MVLTGKERSILNIPVQVPLCPPQISHGLTWDRNRASVFEDKKLKSKGVVRDNFIWGGCGRSITC
jgi:hypothetical protein